MKTILIVDDEALILFSLSLALQRNDRYVKTVSCGKDALAAIDQDCYNLCFLDIHLPDANGLDIMKTIRENSPSTNIIIMSSDTFDDEAQKSILKSARYFLPKPFDLEHVRSLVNRFLGEEVASADDNVSASPPDRFEGNSFTTT